MKIIQSLGFTIVIPLINLSLSAATMPVGPPENRFLYDAAKRQELLSGRLMIFRNAAPFEIDSSLQNQFARRLYYCHQPDKLAPFLMLSDDINSSRFMRARSYESIRAGFSAHPAGHLSFYGNILMDEKMAKDPSYIGKKWRGLAGEIETSFLTYHSQKIDLLAGRFDGNWGTTGQSLILSSTARPMDALSFRYRWGFMQFTYLAGQLNRIRPLDSLGDWQNRYFSGHRFDLKISDHLNIGLFETIVYGWDWTGNGTRLSQSFHVLSFRPIKRKNR